MKYREQIVHPLCDLTSHISTVISAICIRLKGQIMINT